MIIRLIMFLALIGLVVPCCVAAPDDKTERAIAGGLSFLARQQSDDGSFGDGAPRLATTGMALLSYLSAGQTQDVGRHGLTMRRAIEFLLKNKPEKGEDWHGEAMAVLALAEAYPVEPSPHERERISVAMTTMLDDLLQAPPDEDMARLRWRVLALQAAEGAGAKVPKGPIDSAVTKAAESLRVDPQTSAESTASAMIILRQSGNPDRPEMAQGAAFLASQPIDPKEDWTYRGLLASTHAAILTGAPLWGSTWDSTSRLLLALQSPDGSWTAARIGEPPGRDYSTGMAILTLTVPMRVLSSSQR